MSTPKFSDFKSYIGVLLSNVEWNFNFNKLVSIFGDGTYDLNINSLTVNADSSFGGYKATNLATPTLATDGATKAYVDNTAVPRDYLAGYTLSSNIAAPNTDIDIAAGICQNSTNTQAINLGIAFTKRASTAWSTGTGNGMLDTGTFAANTVYNVFAIANASYNTDILCSTSATNPALPTGYTVFRRIGSFKTDASVHIVPSSIHYMPNLASQYTANTNFLRETIGYEVLPSGLIIQWGVTANISQNSSIVVTLPITFPTSSLFASACYGAAPASGNGTAALGVVLTSSSQITITKGSNGSGAEDVLPTMWIAIGY